MTQIDFYVQVNDKQDVVRKLCAKALASGARLMLWTADAAQSQRLSRLLWSTPATGFMPHCGCADPLAGVTPIILDCDLTTLPHDDILINLRSEVPPSFDRFRRLIEIVPEGDAGERQLARERFRYYRERGYAINTHDLVSSSGRTARAG